MSNYTKDKNIITINIDGAGGAYKFDLATAIFYGLKGTPVKTNAKKTAITGLFYPWNARNERSQLAYTLYRMFDHSCRTSDYLRYTKPLSIAEKLDALKLSNQMLSNNALEEIGDNFKDFLAYLKTRPENDKSSGKFHYFDFARYLKIEKAKRKWGVATVDAFPAHIFNNLLEWDCVYDYSAEELSVCLYYLVRGKLYDYHRGNIDTLIKYIDLCHALNKTPKKENNFMREYCETVKEYELRKKEIDSQKIINNYNKRNTALTFEYGDYIVVRPTTGDELIQEGRDMHHCVGGYVDRIISGECYIVFIRKKDTPKECYITCQVHTDGRIGQYFLAYDRYISLAEDKAFKTAFQEHLNAHWNDDIEE